ncbi:hypothetical protein ILUMI_25485 [Ignelater luminosus]|uniref:Proton-coupled folate transporter n=1 Tax=Ignelater luminosus TaxID=2038154 RepID=A0A8K0FW85_IGNLU|nr:hypothetical protein ILUMI_25485 [Ignelater luminosus]
MASTTELVTDSVADLTKDKNQNDTKEEKTFRRMTMNERVAYVKEVITVEPLVTCYIMSSILCSQALTNLEYEKACKANLNYSDTVCDAIISGTSENYTSELVEVQTKVTELHSWLQIVQNVIPIILVLFLGSYSDRHKLRKPFLIMPFFGELGAVVGCILCVIFMREWPVEVQGFMQVVVPSFLGGPTMILMAVFAYIADVSSLEMRTLRIGIVQIVLNITTPIIQSFSGILYDQIGYIWILLIAGVFYLTGILYGLFYIKEPKQPVDVENKKNMIKDIFDPRHALETLKVVTKTSQGNQRLNIILIMIILFIFSGVTGAEGSVFFLYTNYTYGWTVVEFSYFLTINTVVHLVGNIIAVPLFTRILQWPDLIITTVAFLDKIVCNIIFIIFTTTVGLYAGTLVSIIIAISSISIRSYATKVVLEDDLGKAQSLFAIIESVAPIVTVPIYGSWIYTATITSFPQAFFILGIGLYGVAIILMMCMYFRDKKRNVVKSNEVEMENNKVNKGVAETTHI